MQMIYSSLGIKYTHTNNPPTHTHHHHKTNKNGKKIREVSNHWSFISLNINSVNPVIKKNHRLTECI